MSPHEEHTENFVLFDEKLFSQAIDFTTCSEHLLDVVFYRKGEILAQWDLSFPQIYKFSNQDLSEMSIGSPSTEIEKPLAIIWSSGSALQLH